MREKILLKFSLLFIFIFINSNVLISQDGSLYIPTEIEDAYEKGTRSKDGNPGPNYWQNKADYSINVYIDVSSKTLYGDAKIIYYNNSPNTLTDMFINLYQNRNRPEAPRDWDANPKNLNDGFVIKSLKINGIVQNLSSSAFEQFGTLLKINLDIPISPHTSVNLEFEWSFIIPVPPNPRMGAYDSTTYMIAYWYPQIAVYDDLFEWDQLSYTGSFEFYNEFSDYDVKITMPNNFCVWSTGVLQNPSEIFGDELLKRYKLAMSSDSVINMITKNELKNINELFNNKNENNIWHFKAENVTDFAFATSNHYLWDAHSLEVEPGRRVLIGAAFSPQSWDFPSVAGIAYEVIKYFSFEFPRIPFPYPSLTVFNGAGGMEFPMMVNDGSTDNMNATIGVTAHEIAHTYFPFYMGINEKLFAWMDEGWAQFLPVEIQKRLGSGDYDPKARNVFRYLNNAGSVIDVPMMVSSNNLGWGYGLESYFKPACAYDVLRNILGKEIFSEALREYMKKWNGKHPMPYDFFFTIENYTGKNLSWFWNPWWFEFGVPDLAIKEVQIQDGKLTVVVEKIGDLPVPVAITAYGLTSVLHVYERNASVWEDGNTTVTLTENINDKIFLVKLGNKYIPDTDTTNNSWTWK